MLLESHDFSALCWLELESMWEFAALTAAAAVAAAAVAMAMLAL